MSNLNTKTKTSAANQVIICQLIDSNQLVGKSVTYQGDKFLVKEAYFKPALNYFEVTLKCEGGAISYINSLVEFTSKFEIVAELITRLPLISLISPCELALYNHTKADFLSVDRKNEGSVLELLDSVNFLISTLEWNFELEKMNSKANFDIDEYNEALETLNNIASTLYPLLK